MVPIESSYRANEYNRTQNGYRGCDSASVQPCSLARRCSISAARTWADQPVIICAHPRLELLCRNIGNSLTRDGGSVECNTSLEST